VQSQDSLNHELFENPVLYEREDAAEDEVPPVRSIELDIKKGDDVVSIDQAKENDNLEEGLNESEKDVLQ
jgi:hypothetical protein